jgi:ligand-binding sensor domain-containing protein/AraC-like DNA-binding protein
LSSRENLRFDHLILGKHLKQNCVQDILQDSQGFIWLATKHGLIRYDGYESIILEHDPSDPTSLGGNWINSLHQDNEGFLWVCTSDGGLCRLNLNTGEFTTFRHQENNSNSLSHDTVIDILEDDSRIIWLTTIDGLNRFDRETETFKVYRYSLDLPPEKSYNSMNIISVDRSGFLWIGTASNLLLKFDRSKEVFTAYNFPEYGPGGYPINTGHTWEDRNGAFWVGTCCVLGLAKLDRNTFDIKIFSHDPNNPNSISRNMIMPLLEDSHENFWVGTWGGGLNLFNRKDETFTVFKPLPNDPYSINNLDILRLYEDRGGNIWIGTNGGGVNKLDRSKWKFQPFDCGDKNLSNWQDKDIRAIFLDSSGLLWVGTYYQGLYLIDRTNAKVINFQSDKEKSRGFPALAVNAICEDKYGIIWLATDKGLCRFDRNTDKIKFFQHLNDNPRSLSSYGADVLFIDQDEDLWVGTPRGGLNRFHPETEDFTIFRHDPRNIQSLSSDVVTSIFQDKQGTLWVGTANGGLNRFNKKTGTFIAFKKDSENLFSLTINTILTIYEDQEERFWIGTNGGGLSRFDRDAKKFYSFTVKDGLANNIVKGILEDSCGFLWISTASGLSKFDPGSKIFTNFSTDNGLPGNNFNVGATFLSKTGEMFFGSSTGLVAFYPQDIKKNRRTVPVVITDIRVGDQSLVKNGIALSKSVTLGPADNNLIIKFASLDFSGPQMKRYSYRLEGFDRQWIHSGTRRTAIYTGLPSGKYTFRIKGTNCDGVWNSQGTSLYIHIKEHFHKNIWFWSLILLFIIIVYASIYYKSMWKKKKSVDKTQRYYAERIEEYIEKLQTFLKEKKPFLDPDITLPKLAEEIGISVNHLSYIINKNYKTNFNDFINEFRVAEAKIRLSDPRYKDLKIISIALEVGFNSKTTFNVIFKRKTGMTPSQYQKKAISD